MGLVILCIDIGNTSKSNVLCCTGNKLAADDFFIAVILSSIAKSTILQYRQCIAGGGFATKSCRSYCPRKADGFAAAFSGTANNTVVCNKGQYITDDIRSRAHCMLSFAGTAYDFVMRRAAVSACNDDFAAFQTII